MVEPVSAITIVTTVVKAVTTSITTAQTISDYVSKYKIAEIQIVAMITECSTIRHALLELQNIVTRSNIMQDPAEGQPETENEALSYVRTDYRGILTQCLAVFALLNERLEKLNVQGLNRRSKSSAKAKIRTVWNGDSMKNTRENIRGQVGAINLLLHAFQMGALAESSASNKKNFETVFEILTEIKSTTLLGRIAKSAKSLSIAPAARRTIEDNEDAQSILEHSNLVFEGALAQSDVYRRTVPSSNTGSKAKHRTEDYQSDRHSFFTAQSKVFSSVKSLLRTPAPTVPPARHRSEEPRIEMQSQSQPNQRIPSTIREETAESSKEAEIKSLKEVQDAQRDRWEYLVQLSPRNLPLNQSIDEYEETQKEFEERASSLRAQIAGKPKS